MRKLLSAIEYWDSISIDLSETVIIHDMERYCRHLKQPLQLGFFVPCDKEGRPLKKPEETDYMFGVGNKSRKLIIDEAFEKDMKEYQQAYDRVLFKGFEYGENPAICFVNGKDVTVAFNKDTLKPFWPKLQTINDLANKVEVTDMISKQFKIE